MRTLDEINAAVPTQEARVKEIRQHADAIGSVPGPAWSAIAAQFELAIAEANDAATHPDTVEDKRPGWCARERGLRDLWRDLDDLRSGEWKDWPEIQATQKPKTQKEQEEED